MSLLNAWVRPSRGLVAVDTDTITRIGTHLESSKLIPLVHAHTVFAARGDRRFLWDLVSKYFLASEHVDFDVIVRSLPSILAGLVLAFRQEGVAPFPYQFTVVGFSPLHGEVRGHWYTGHTGSDDFDSSELGQRLAPWETTDPAPMPESLGAMRAIAERQVPMLRARKAAGGGKLLVAEITPSQIVLHNLGEL